MSLRRLRPLFATALLFAFSTSLALLAQDSDSTHRGRKYKAPPPTSRVEVTVLRRDDGKPIENAAVIFTMVGDKGNMELKTNEDGKAVIDVLPQGSKVVVQVLAKGFQTYGKDYDIDKPELAFEVKLNRPGKQYSIYENHPQAAKQDNGTGNTSPDASKDSSKDSQKKAQSSESADDAGSKPESNQPQPQ
jgi:hypothetical protein